MYEIKIAKERVRAQYIEKRRSLTEAQRHERDAKLCRRFLSLVTYRYADALLMYAPKGGEIDVTPIAEAALRAGKTVAYPRCEPSGCTMNFHIVTSLDQLKRGSYGIMEPPESLELFAPETGITAACVIPALVYDRAGYRLGYGKGYYDRYLADFAGVKVGFVYSDFIVSRVPRGRYDLSCDVLVTEKGVRALHAK